jgi:hypothetical protein
MISDLLSMVFVGKEKIVNMSSKMKTLFQKEKRNRKKQEEEEEEGSPPLKKTGSVRCNIAKRLP